MTATTCNCRPLRIVAGVPWRYRPDTGWHQPGEHTEVPCRAVDSTRVWGATSHSEAPHGLASAGASNPQLDHYIEGADDHHGLT